MSTLQDDSMELRYIIHKAIEEDKIIITKRKLYWRPSSKYKEAFYFDECMAHGNKQLQEILTSIGAKL